MEHMASQTIGVCNAFPAAAGFDVGIAVVIGPALFGLPTSVELTTSVVEFGGVPDSGFTSAVVAPGVVTLNANLTGFPSDPCLPGSTGSVTGKLSTGDDYVISLTLFTG